MVTTIEAQGTPGPWEVVQLNHFGPFAIRMQYNAEQLFYGVRQIHRVHDARLIAAAPDMAEALWAMLEMHGNDLEEAAARDKARAALTKAGAL